MSVLNQSGDEQVECPLCMEPLEVDDLNFFPCTCGYQICRFCWHRIRTDENGLCPACRKAYPEDPADFKPLSKEELSKLKAEKRHRDMQRKQKVTESRKHLANVRVVQNNLVFVVGLPMRLADPDTLKKHEYFGKFGKIHKVVINQSTTYAGSQGPSASAYVTYHRSEDALRAIQAVNNITVDGRTLKTSLGTTKYCSHFLKNQTCPKADCMYLHDMGDPGASFTKEEMQLGKHQEYERKLHENLINNTNNRKPTPSPPTVQPANGPGGLNGGREVVNVGSGGGGGVNNSTTCGSGGGGGSGGNSGNSGVIVGVADQTPMNSNKGEYNNKKHPHTKHKHRTLSESSSSQDREMRNKQHLQNGSAGGSKETSIIHISPVEYCMSGSGNISSVRCGAGDYDGSSGGNGGSNLSSSDCSGGSCSDSGSSPAPNCNSIQDSPDLLSSSLLSQQRNHHGPQPLRPNHHHPAGDGNSTKQRAAASLFEADNNSFFSSNSFTKVLNGYCGGHGMDSGVLSSTNGGGEWGIMPDDVLPQVLHSTEDWQAAFGFTQPSVNHHNGHTTNGVVSVEGGSVTSNQTATLHHGMNHLRQPSSSPINNQSPPPDLLNDSQTIRDDDLGFDPFHETQKALAEMIEKEEQNHFNNPKMNLINHNNRLNSCSALLQSLRIGRPHASAPPPGFTSTPVSHMNAFGLGIPRTGSKILPFIHPTLAFHSHQPQSSLGNGMAWDWSRMDPAIVSVSGHHNHIQHCEIGPTQPPPPPGFNRHPPPPQPAATPLDNI